MLWVLSFTGKIPQKCGFGNGRHTAKLPCTDRSAVPAYLDYRRTTAGVWPARERYDRAHRTSPVSAAQRHSFSPESVQQLLIHRAVLGTNRSGRVGSGTPAWSRAP